MCTGSKQVVEALVKAKADVNAANEAGHTALMMAATNGFQKDPKEAVDVRT
jgi:ankyrin repeat protein